MEGLFKMAGGNVIVIGEAGRGQTESANARLIAIGDQLAEHGGGKLVCLLAGQDVGAKAAELSRYVDEIRISDSVQHAHYDPEALLTMAEHLVDELQPRAVLLGHTFMGMDLAPRLAAKLRVGVASNCFAIRIEDDAVYFMRPMYRGRVQAKVAMDSTPMVATLQLGGPELPLSNRAGEVKKIDPKPTESRRIRPLRTIEPVRTGIDITKADIVVSGGRGVGEKENFALVNDLAEALGGVPACSRPLVDMGWFSTSLQVGLSGNTVKPKLYIACGISGAVEHLHGMKESRIIVAINKDPDAPIFKVAHYGVVGDLNEIMPQLTRKIRECRSQK
jgi:electron transfer flavoprotein alpha subunit